MIACFARARAKKELEVRYRHSIRACRRVVVHFRSTLFISFHDGVLAAGSEYGGILAAGSRCVWKKRRAGITSSSSKSYGLKYMRTWRERRYWANWEMPRALSTRFSAAA